MAQQNDKSKTVKEFRSRNIQASIRKSKVEKGGRIVPQYSVRIVRRYRRSNGTYGTTN